MAIMPNMQHRWLPPFTRRVPLIVVAYCFSRSSEDVLLMTVLVAKLYPQGVVCACPCDQKGPDA